MSGRRNILIIVQNLPVPFDRRVWQEATSLQRAGFGVSVVCPKKKMYTKGYERLEGIDIYRYPLLVEADTGVLAYFAEFAYCWLATLFLAVRAYFRHRFQVIHACNPPDTFWALALLFRPLGVKFVFDHHDLSPEMYLAKGKQKDFLYRALLWLERRTLRFADRVIAVNQSHREIAIQRGKVPEEKVAVVRSGPRRSWADIEAAEPGLKRGRKYLVAYLGEMCEQDGVDHLLRAIRYYADHYPPDTQFVLIGGGPDQQRMKNMAAALGLDEFVHFTGRIPDKDLWKYLATSDVCVDPDPLTEWSDLSTMNKMIEYMAFGKPVVAFRLKEHQRTAGDAAIYVEPNQDEKLGAAIRELLLAEARAAAMSKYAKRRFREQLAWENSERVLVALYAKLIGESVEPKLAAAAGKA